MKYSVAALVAAAAAVTAQTGVDGVPKCARPCVEVKDGKIAGCSLVDFDCVCNNSSFLSDMACCVAPLCDQAGQDATIAYAKKICGDNPDVPDKVVCSTASKSSTPTAGASGGSSDKPASTSGGSGASETSATDASGESAPSSSPTDSAAVAVGGAGGLVGAVFAMLFAM